MGAALLEALDRCFARLGMDPPVGHLLGPGEQQVVEDFERVDPLVGGLVQERLADEAVEAFLLATAFGRIGRRVHETDPEHRTGPGQPGVLERRPVIGIEHLGQPPADDGLAQRLLAGPCVLLGEEPAVDQQPGVVVDDQEQLGPDRRLDLGVGTQGPTSTSVIQRALGASAS